MGHGIGGTKSAGLLPFARRFLEAGYATVMFDYLYFGDSQGSPENTMSVAQELQDFRDVIAWARRQEHLWDIHRIIAWGSSFGGMHVASLMAQDHGLAAGIMQCPCVDGLAAARMNPILKSLRMVAIGLADWLWSFISEDPIYVPLVSDGELALAVMSGSEATQGWNRMLVNAEGTMPKNKISARVLLFIPFYRPINQIHTSVKPILVVLPTWDNQAPLAAAEEAARLAPFGEVLRLPGGHFDVYEGGAGFDENIKGQLDFLRRI